MTSMAGLRPLRHLPEYRRIEIGDEVSGLAAVLNERRQRQPLDQARIGNYLGQRWGLAQRASGRYS